jgi:hypothetical protein
MRALATLLTGLALLASNSSASAQSAATIGQPAPSAFLGAPRPSLTAPQSVNPQQPQGISPPAAKVARAVSPDPLVGDYSPAARLGEISEAPPSTAVPASALSSPQERYNWGIPDSLAPSKPSAAPSPPSASSASQSKFGEEIGDFFSRQGFNLTFQSDHCFDDFVSPMTNPFLAEDPRALTEIRPLLIYQTIPHGSVVNGGNLIFLGARGSVAFTERFSVTLDKLGGMALNPGQGSAVDGGTGLTEIWLGPKYTFYRNDQSRTIAAAGAIFQIPTGPTRIFQSTGDLSIVPYGTIAQKFGKSSFGEFQVLDTAGLAFSVNNQRSDYFYNTLHLDFDVLNWQRIFPLIELNWFHYTSNGQFSPLGIEGADIANIGSAVAGRNFLNLAFGSRFKVSESVTTGFAVEFPLLNTRDLMEFRLGFDLIWRF